mmetsp:Transcript_43904/g.139855  ORF Transcript_43904/g.139855 Transcript_43904/m.139855 type:complete len:406 (-) Transcript_43904:527-1744(-)
MNAGDFMLTKHGTYFKKHMKTLPVHYKLMDTNRLTLLFFCISGLDLLDMLDDIDGADVIRYIYSLQSTLADHGGFYGYPQLHCDSEEQERRNNQPHIANTYVALAMLIVLGDDLRRVNRAAIAHSLKKWQLPDGSFCCVHGISSLDSESDMRFVYCAACICYILDLWDAIDIERMLHFILASQSYDNAFGMGPHTESHGGCTYCALAALSMMGRLQDLVGKEQLIGWCVKRQHLGFQGRIEKAMDSCYSFWVGASLKLLGAGSFIDSESCAQFLKDCESTATGGFQKFPEVKAPDLLHSYFSVCGLSFCGMLRPLNPILNISERAFSTGASGFRMAPGGRDWTPPPVFPAPNSGLPPPGSCFPPSPAIAARASCKPAMLLLLVAILLPPAIRLLASSPSQTLIVR